MSQRTDYSDDEWFTLWRPIADVPTAVMVAHPKHIVQEAFAADHALDHAATACEQPLLTMLFRPTKEETEWLSQRLDIQRRYHGRSDSDQFMNDALDECRVALTLLESKADPAEGTEYRQRLFAIALEVANAAKEGGFLGLGGTRLDESERVLLRDLAEVLGVAWQEESTAD
jgi:hypothetical protein